MNPYPSRSIARAMIAAWLMCQGTVIAGMPMVTLTDVGRMRLSTVSFFLLLILLSAAGIRSLWNGLRSDFPQLPEISFCTSVRGVLLWGIMFVVVLTMISGARELMTPGAWVKKGLTYQLAEESDAADQKTQGQQIADEVQRQIAFQAERMSRLQQLHVVLLDWARRHGDWPDQVQFLELPEVIRTMPGDFPAPYLYRTEIPKPQSSASEDLSVDAPFLVIEPLIFDGQVQLALDAAGMVRQLRNTP
ncbi:MAG: hypothetical protein R3C20_13760 [Planctomycetaceae bacterium]